jgi:hypothetical protein
MWMRRMVALVIGMAFGCASTGMADARSTHHHHRTPVVQDDGQWVAPSANYGGRLVLHPAHNIACMTQYSSTRALPCDHPVWVYGSPCEVDLGRGRYRSCD